MPVTKNNAFDLTLTGAKADATVVENQVSLNGGTWSTYQFAVVTDAPRYTGQQREDPGFGGRHPRVDATVETVHERRWHHPQKQATK